MILWVEYYDRLPIIVSDNPSVYEMKEQIQIIHEIPLQNQLLYFSNVLLHNELYADLYGIQPFDQLDLYKMRSFTIDYGSSTYRVDISDRNLVSVLAQLVGQQIGITEAKFILCWEEETLDDKTIRDYKIPENGAVLRVMPKMEIKIQGSQTLYTAYVCGLTSVAKVKQMLEDAAGLDKSIIQLISPSYSTAYLSDDLTMFDCGIDELQNNTLLLLGD